MPRFFEKMLLILVMSFSVLAIGCETTDYEPLIMKKKLKEMEARIKLLEEKAGIKDPQDSSADTSATAAEDAGANVVDTIKADKAQTQSAMVTKPKPAIAIERLETFLTKDQSGTVVQANLTSSRQLETHVAKLAGHKHLKKIFLDGSKSNTSTFESLGQVSSLEHLEIPGCNPSPSDLGELKQLKGLKFLQLANATLSEAAMEELSEFPALEQIRCAQTSVGDAELKQLGKLETLRAIDLSQCDGVTVEGIKSLTKCPKLTFLKVSGDAIDNQCMAEVGKMKSLRVLGISDTAVDDEGIAELAGLNLSEVQMTRTKVGDDGIKILSKMKGLKSLNLRDTRLTDTAVGYISGLEYLTKLDLSECTEPGITDACASEIAKMKNLKSLNLWATGFSDEGVEELTGMKNLTRLNLDKTNVTDDSVAMLKKMPQLTWLHLGKTKITDREKKVLMGLENLKYLNISFTQISDDGYSDISKHLGELGCEIIAP